MLTYLQSIFLGLVQGITELFPISSLGHSVLIPALLNWKIDQGDPYFVSFLVLTHLATALVLLGFFWRDWVKVITGIVRSLVTRSLVDPYARLGWLLIVGTIPAGLLGLLFQHKLEALFAAPQAAAVFLIGNAFVLYFAEGLVLRNRVKEVARSMVIDTSDDMADSLPIPVQTPNTDERLSTLSWGKAVGIGVMQCLALLPGFSRTGATMTGGLFSGLSHEDAARFSFLLATPIIFAAALLKVPHLASVGTEGIKIALAGAVAAAIAAFFSVRFLTRYFKTSTLRPFAAYCLAIGLVSLFILSVY
jgi:undecaprenyl-diphosphatase